MNAHTPGPWTTQPCSSGGLVVSRGDVQNLQIVPVEDARLIAAAPDLYDAAVWVLHNAHGISKSGEDGVSQEEENASWGALMAATRKAEGK